MTSSIGPSWGMILIASYCNAALGAASARPTTIVRLLPSFYAVIDAGKNDGLILADRVCFLSKNNREVGCGEVVVATAGAAGVKVTKETRAALTVGQIARAVGIVGPRTNVPPNAEELDRIERELLALREAAPREKAPVAPEQPRKQFGTTLRVEAGLLVAPLLPYTYSVPNYDLDAEKSGSPALWKADREVRSSPIGVLLQAHVPLSGSWSIVPYITYRYIATDQLDVDYSESETEVFARGKTRASDRGLGVDFQLMAGHGDGWNWEGGAGIALTQSKLAIDVAQESDAEGNNESIATYRSTLTVMALKGGSSVAWITGPIGFCAGAAMLIPIAGNPKVETKEVSEKFGIDEDASAAALVRAVDHHRTDIGFELWLSAEVALR